VAGLLVALDLPHEPAFAPARDPPQVELEWDDPTQLTELDLGRHRSAN
jgi:hypothetical protein